MPQKASANSTADAIRSTLVSPNESDRNFEPANVVDGLFFVGRAIGHAFQQAGGTDPATRPSDLEVHGTTIRESAELIASALHDVADAIRTRQAGI